MKLLSSNWCRGMLFLAALLCFAGCSRTKPGLPVTMVGREVPAELQPIVSRMEKEGERNWVLHLNELAVSAMRRGDRELAKAALDESILHINAVFGRTPQANRARSLFFDEGAKLFKGDPYERCMTFFYRGILYMQENDWENARAAFRAGALQDAFAEEEQHRADWTIFDYLIGVCEIQLGRAHYAEEAYALAEANFVALSKASQADFKNKLASQQWELPRLGPEDNILVVTQTGTGPRKATAGSYRQQIAYHRGVNPNPVVAVVVGDQEKRGATLVDSVYYQATTRGGRPFDKIQGRKVFFKQTSETVGTVGVYSGAVVFSNADTPEEAVIGLALIATGAAAAVFAELIKTKADIRQWTSLPDALGLYFAQHPAGEARVAVQANGNQWVEAPVEVPEPGHGLAVVLAFPGPNPVLLTP